jgi:hypothetical protein
LIALELQAIQTLALEVLVKEVSGSLEAISA